MLAVWHTAVEYHFYHALGLLAVGLVAARLPRSVLVQWSGWVMAAGMVLFCGSLYALALSEDKSWGLITPFGGITLLVAWVLFALGVVTTKN
jgi:uncharacterized membrane protein YgdD (TMEM256/DUF423 family)